MPAVSEAVDVRLALLNRFAEARTQTDKLFELVRADALYERPIPERHRIIFYLGHLEAFDWNLLHSRLPGVKVFDPEFDRLFAFGIDPVDGGLPSDQPSDWPARALVERYRDRIRTKLDDVLANGDFGNWSGDEPPQVLLNVAIEHRLMHAETLAYMLHQLPFDQKHGEAQAAAPAAGPVRAGMIEIPGGRATLGISRHDPASFGWDNEYETTSVDVPAFVIDRNKVTNGDYLKFVEAGGYEDRSLWTAGAWAWKAEQGIEHPLFWSKSANGWRYRGMFEEIPLPLDWPVYVSHAEANAYAAWAGKRLPTEAEWHRAAYGTVEGIERDFPWGAEPPQPRHGYFDFARWDPSPVNAFPAGRSALGVEGLMANGWEWTSSLFEPLPGFRPFPFYEGYSANFFDGMHFVMKGGSPRTEQCMLRRSFRNWFQPHYQYVYAGFRCAAK
ncbi:MAG TPA: SUMF1/EgtB/PvdO family nonheme iron enzyme [Bryobacteraceae bacterium]